jgi:hypothetical protein
MDQIVAHKAVFMPFAERHTASLESQASIRTAQSGMVAQPGARNLRFGRAAGVLAQAGQRLVVIARRVGQPADTYTGPSYLAPEDIRARYQSGVFGSTDLPRSMRDPGRNW